MYESHSLATFRIQVFGKLRRAVAAAAAFGVHVPGYKHPPLQTSIFC
jgi:hypothetical protein